MGVPAKLDKLLTFGFCLAASYFLAYELFKVFGIPWHNILNIPGLFLYFLSMPWSVPFSAYMLEISGVIGGNANRILLGFTESLGFGVNLYLAKRLLKKLKAST